MKVYKIITLCFLFLTLNACSNEANLSGNKDTTSDNEVADEKIEKDINEGQDSEVVKLDNSNGYNVSIERDLDGDGDNETLRINDDLDSFTVNISVIKAYDKVSFEGFNDGNTSIYLTDINNDGIIEIILNHSDRVQSTIDILNYNGSEIKQIGYGEGLIQNFLEDGIIVTEYPRYSYTFEELTAIVSSSIETLPYFPIDDSSISYRVRSAEEEYDISYLGKETIDGKDVYLEHRSYGTIIMYEINDTKDIYYVGYIEDDVVVWAEEPILALPGEFKENDTFNSGGETFTFLGLKEVVLDSNRFSDCLYLESDQGDSSMPTMTYYYCKDIGLVQYSPNADSSNFMMFVSMNDHPPKVSVNYSDQDKKIDSFNNTSLGLSIEEFQENYNNATKHFVNELSQSGKKINNYELTKDINILQDGFFWEDFEDFSIIGQVNSNQIIQWVGVRTPLGNGIEINLDSIEDSTINALIAIDSLAISVYPDIDMEYLKYEFVNQRYTQFKGKAEVIISDLKFIDANSEYYSITVVSHKNFEVDLSTIY